jgi:hypothetical protein
MHGRSTPSWAVVGIADKAAGTYVIRWMAGT